MWTERPILDAPHEPGSGFTVLAICTGNICRSPAVERLLLAAIPGDPTVTVSSAGTQAVVGHPIAAPMAELLRTHGADPAQFAARQLVAPMAARADLVLALTREHRSAALTLHPRALRRTVTLRELARVAYSVDRTTLDAAATGPTSAERLAALVPLAIAARGHRAVDPREDDVVDPWRRSDAVYRESIGQITDALEAIHQAIMR